MKANFRSVVAVDGDALEDVPEIALELLVAFFGNGVVVAHPGSIGVGGHRGVVHGTQQSRLLIHRGVDEILAEKFVASLIDFGKSVEKRLPLRFRGPIGENYVDKFVDARSLRARRFGHWNDQVDHGDDQSVLLGAERAELIT